MELEYDGKLDIAEGLKFNSKTWKNKTVAWSWLVERLSSAQKTSETYSQFIKATKAEQAAIKDVGGFVGGYLVNGKRTKDAVSHRQLITLDIDFSHDNLWWDFSMLYDCAAVIHSTHKSTADKPRHRLIIPLNREVTSDEYEPIARYIANSINIELFDQTTYEINRFMFWPSVSSDIDYYFEFHDGPWLDADSILAAYTDWKDINEWPHAKNYDSIIAENIKKQEDPKSKKGIIGAFCRANTIHDAIANYLSDIYECTADDNRYTYVNGTTAAGLIVYDDVFAYSHHSTDPAGGRLCNAFDLVRIHLYGHLDSGKEKDEISRASFKAMEELATKDKPTKRIIAEEKFAEAKLDFEVPIEDEEYDNSWVEQLEANKNGEYNSTAPNINLILQNDRILKNAFSLNLFDNRRYLNKSMPWRKLDNNSIEPMRDVDYSGVRNYIECVYGISSSLKIDDSIALEIERNNFHPIRKYIKSLSWDGVERINTLLVDYFGVEDTIYSRAVIRKALCAAVARVFCPGIKYDMVLILVGPQGTYKSTFIKKLGVDWFSDTFTTVQGKEAYEQLQGAWIIEMAELSALKKSEAEGIKQFISKCDDAFRPAYGRTVEVYKRQCVFFGTTNDVDFLKDPTGNRRFNPIDIHPECATKSVATDFTRYEIDQVWAEAYKLWNDGEELYFNEAENAMAKQEQTTHSAVDERLGIIDDYLNKLLPEDWDFKDLYDRRTWLDDPIAKPGTVEREYVCIAEIWCECLHKDKQEMSRYNTREINDMLRAMKEWEFMPTTKSFPLYGKQKYYRKRKQI